MTHRCLIATFALLLSLGGCASINQLNSQVATYGPWPGERKASSYAFERLPSQQQEQPERRQVLEDAARGALAGAGFSAAADPASADYVVQLGARVTSNDPWIYNDALFWRGGLRFGVGFGHRGHGPWRRGWGPGWGWGVGFAGAGYSGSTSFEREVALLIRDRPTGALLYEARATSNSFSASIEPVLPALFQAALHDFPVAGPNPRSVTVPLSKP